MSIWAKHAEVLSEVFPRERLEARVLTALGKASAAKESIAVACSGGIDSLVAFLLTWAHFPETRERLFVLHFNHAQRGEASDGDASFVEKICTELGVKFIGEKLRSDLPANSENALRNARLDFFTRAMDSCSAKILVQGHQHDDVAESFIMRATRGAGTDGLAAPRPVSRQADGRIYVRPLLGIHKAELTSCAKHLNIAWREDASNAGCDYFRNRIRNKILPELKQLAPFENFARARMLAEEDADALADFAMQSKLGEIRVPAVVRRQLWQIFETGKIAPGTKNFDALVAAVCAGTPLKFSAGTQEVTWDGNSISIITPTEENPQEITGSIQFSQEIVHITQDIFEQICAGKFSENETVFLAGSPEIVARKWQAGDRYHPLGAPGEKSVGDAFTDKKIPRERRKLLPVFCDGTGIAWIPGLPPAERFRIPRAGILALRLTYRGASLTLSEQISNE